MFRVSVCFTGQTLVRIYKKCMGRSPGSRLTNTFTMSCLPHFWLFTQKKKEKKNSLLPAFVSECGTILHSTLSNPLQGYFDDMIHISPFIIDDVIIPKESTNLTSNCSRMYSGMRVYVKRQMYQSSKKVFFFFLKLLIRTEHRELIKICRKQFAQLT